MTKTESAVTSVAWDFPLWSLTQVVGTDDEERLLCPVQALKWHQHKTHSQCRLQQLLLSVRDSS